MNVYVVAGWFGEYEWIEAICETPERADEIAHERWQDRRSLVLPADDYRQGIAKFGVEGYVTAESLETAR